MRTIRLSKLHATGNDFLVGSWLHEHAGVPTITAAQAAALCDRHRGIGADGLIVVTPGKDGADAEMLLYNADGGIAEMTGNGMTTLAWVAASESPGHNGTLTVDTGGGRRAGRADLPPERHPGANVDMGAAPDPAETRCRVVSVRPRPVEYHGTLRGRRCRNGEPAPGAVSSPTPLPPGHPARSAPRARRAFPRRTNVEFTVRRTPAPTSSTPCGSGSAAVGESAQLRHRACARSPVAHRRGLVGNGPSCRTTRRRPRVSSAITSVSGGPVVHVFDVEVQLPRVPASQGRP
jgi:diaminopimelate epimerase